MKKRRKLETGSIKILLGQAIFAVTLGAVCAATVDGRGQANNAPTFDAQTLSASRATVQFDASGLSAVGGSMFLVCRTAALTIERSFKYFRMENERSESRGKGSIEVEFFQTPPKGVEVVRAESSRPNVSGPGEKPVFDAVSWVTACKQLGLGGSSAK